MTTPSFDRNASYAMAQFATVLGHGLNVGTPIQIVDGADGSTAGQLDPTTAQILFDKGTIAPLDDIRPTPVETPEQEARRVISIEPLGGGWWLIRSPWLEEPEKVQGEDEAHVRYEELIAAGRPAKAVPTPNDGTGLVPNDEPVGFTLAETGSNGYFEINGPGMAKPEKVRGKAEADGRLAELQAEYAAQQAAGTAEVPPKED